MDLGSLFDRTPSYTVRHVVRFPATVDHELGYIIYFSYHTGKNSTLSSTQLTDAPFDIWEGGGAKRLSPQKFVENVDRKNIVDELDETYVDQNKPVSKLQGTE